MVLDAFTFWYKCLILYFCISAIFNIFHSVEDLKNTFGSPNVDTVNSLGTSSHWLLLLYLSWLKSLSILFISTWYLTLYLHYNSAVFVLKYMFNVFCQTHAFRWVLWAVRFSVLILQAQFSMLHFAYICGVFSLPMISRCQYCTSSNDI